MKKAAVLSLAFVLALSVAGVPQDGSQSDSELQSKINQLISKLSSDSAEERDKASADLHAIGKPALEKLLQAAKSEDTEVRSRADSIIDSLLRPAPPAKDSAPMVSVPFMVAELRQPAPDPPLDLHAPGGFFREEGRFPLPARSAGEEPLPVVSPFGVTTESPSDLLRSHLFIPEGRGLVIVAVGAESTADKLGLELYDIVLAVDGNPATSLADLEKATEEATVELIRKGRKCTIVPLAKADGPAALPLRKRDEPETRALLEGGDVPPGGRAEAPGDE